MKQLPQKKDIDTGTHKLVERFNQLIEFLTLQDEHSSEWCKGYRHGDDIECGCSCHNAPQEYKNYNRDYSHTHCWNQKQPSACGIPLEKHTQCCLCDMPKPQEEKKICGCGCHWGGKYDHAVGTVSCPCNIIPTSHTETDNLDEIISKRESKMYSYYKSVFVDDFEGGYPIENDNELKQYVSSTVLSVLERVEMAVGGARRRTRDW
jgi:hypothetical protein